MLNVVIDNYIVLWLNPSTTSPIYCLVDIDLIEMYLLKQTLLLLFRLEAIICTSAINDITRLYCVAIKISMFV